MSFAELLLILGLGILIYRALTPLRLFFERFFSRLFGVRGPNVIDVRVVRDKKVESPPR